MVNSISNVRYQDYLDHTLSFEWMLSGNTSTWSAKSPIFDLYDKRQCVLEIVCVKYSNQCTYDVTLSLKAIGNFDFKPSEKIRVCMYFKSNSNGKCIFNLTRVDSKQFNDKQLLAFTDSMLSCDKIDAIFEINCREYTSSVSVKDFTLLLNSAKYSDLDIDVRDTTFKVHKNIISSRSLVLAKMLDADMTEKHNNKIILNDWRPETVEAFLMFLYTGTCQIENNYDELFKLAHLLQQSDLMKIVEKYMKHSIEMNNFVSLFEIADTYELKDLYSTVEHFFRANKSECVKDPSFESYLRNSIKVSNIRFVLEIAHEYKMTETLRDAMEFIKTNYEKIATDSENRNFIKNKHDLLFQMFEHSVGYSPDQQM